MADLIKGILQVFSLIQLSYSGQLRESLTSLGWSTLEPREFLSKNGFEPTIVFLLQDGCPHCIEFVNQIPSIMLPVHVE